MKQHTLSFFLFWSYDSDASKHHINIFS